MAILYRNWVARIEFGEVSRYCQRLSITAIYFIYSNIRASDYFVFGISNCIISLACNFSSAHDGHHFISDCPTDFHVNGTRSRKFIYHVAFSIASIYRYLAITSSNYGICKTSDITYFNRVTFILVMTVVVKFGQASRSIHD